MSAFAKARAAEAASKEALRVYCNEHGWPVAFFEGDTGSPRSGIIDATLFCVGRHQQCSVSVLTAVKRVPGTPKVFVTGHSLGGAMATLATADLAINGIAAAMYNIASPRVGNAAFAGEFNINGQVAARWRIVNTEDIVTTVPLATPNLGAILPPTSPFALLLLQMHNLDYTHVGTAVNFTVNNGSIIENHDIKTYIAALA